MLTGILLGILALAGSVILGVFLINSLKLAFGAIVVPVLVILCLWAWWYRSKQAHAELADQREAEWQEELRREREEHGVDRYGRRRGDPPIT